MRTFRCSGLFEGDCPVGVCPEGGLPWGVSASGWCGSAMGSLPRKCLPGGVFPGGACVGGMYTSNLWTEWLTLVKTLPFHNLPSSSSVSCPLSEWRGSFARSGSIWLGCGVVSSLLLAFHVRNKRWVSGEDPGFSVGRGANPLGAPTCYFFQKKTAWNWENFGPWPGRRGWP